VHTDLILWTDVQRDPKGYGYVMQPLHVLWRDVRAHVRDYVVAASMVAIALVALVTRIDVQDADVHRFHQDTWWSWAVTIAVCATLVGRRRWPLRSLAVGLVLMLPLELARHRDSIAFFALVIALYSVATYLPLRSALRGVAMIAALYAALHVGGATVIIAAPLTGPVFFAIAFAFGRMLRLGHTRQERQVEAAIERAAAVAETADLRAADERLRLAQELHDVVAHSLSVIAVQAGIGVHLIDRQPAQAAQALDAIRTTSHTAAGELTRLVDILRDGGSPDGASAPTLADVTVLIEQLRTAGVSLTFTTDGDLDTVPAGVSLAAYRIVQEALTNVVRHAGRAQVTVTVRVSDDHIDLCVDDDGRGVTRALDPGSRDAGHGLIGMGERARMYGGDVRSGPRPGGGFRVRATLRHAANPTASEPATNSDLDSTIADIATPNRRRLPPWMWDVMLAILIAGVVALEIVAAGPTVGPRYSPMHFWGWLLRLGCCVPLAVRRRYPTMSFAVIWVLSMALKIGGYQVGFVVFALALGLFTVGSYATPRRLGAAAIAIYAEMALTAASTPPELSAAAAVWICILFTAVAVAGAVVRRDRERRTADLAEREDAVVARSRHALLVITTERLRIADELSTIITRSIDTIAQQAGAGSQMVDIDPIAAGKALEVISAISRDALNDLRRLLKRMRTGNEPAIYTPITPAADSVTAGGAR
jgi:signal transduction histidine kinase